VAPAAARHGIFSCRRRRRRRRLLSFVHPRVGGSVRIPKGGKLF